MIAEEKKLTKKKKPRDFELYDRLILTSRAENGDTVWTGQGGSRYVFCKLSGGEGRPVVKVIRDGKFLTGLFKTKKQGIYSGDILLNTNKSGKKKSYLRLKVITKEKINLDILC